MSSLFLIECGVLPTTSLGFLDTCLAIFSVTLPFPETIGLKLGVYLVCLPLVGRKIWGLGLKLDTLVCIILG